MELGDEPQLGLQVTPSSLCSNEPQDVVVPHAWSDEHISLVLPRLFVLSDGEGRDVKHFWTLKRDTLEQSG